MGASTTHHLPKLTSAHCSNKGHHLSIHTYAVTKLLMAYSEMTTATNYPTQEAGGPTVYVMMDKDNRKNTFAMKTAKGLSVTQITLGVISILCQGILIFLYQTYNELYDNIAGIGEGIYCGVFFLIAGCLGLLSSRKPSTCNISAFMTLSIIASVFGAAQIIIASFNLIGVRFHGYYGPADDVQVAKVVLFSIMILAGLVEGIIAIISSAVCCRGSCCTGGPASGQVVYLSQGPAAQSAPQGQVVYLSRGPAAQTTPQPRYQTLSKPPSYGDVVQHQLETKDTQKYDSGNYMRF